MKKLKFYIPFIFSFFCLSQSFSQNEEPEVRALYNASSPDGNYIYLYLEGELFTDTQILSNTKNFIIEKAIYSAEKAAKGQDFNFKEAGRVAPENNLKTIKEILGEQRTKDMVNLLHLNNENELVAFIAAHPQPAYYGFLYQFIELKRILGHVFLDAEAKPGEVVMYRVKRNTKKGASENWGSCIIHTGIGNYTLSYLKPHAQFTDVSDSLVRFNFILDARQDELKIPVRPISKIQNDTGGAFSSYIPFPIRSHKARIYINRAGKWNYESTLLPSLRNDTLFFSYVISSKPNEQLAAYLELEDEVHNRGGFSDTVTSYTITSQNCYKLIAIRTTEQTGCIKISWDALPDLPYLSGVELCRIDRKGKLDTLQILSVKDTAYLDYDLIAGDHYTYEARVVYSPETGLYQDFPAQAAGTYSKFGIPLPPEDLTATDTLGNVLLQWKKNQEAGIYAYYIYRGTNPDNLLLIAGPVKEAYFLDSSSSLSGRSTYFYAITSENLNQDTSTFSETISIRPSRKINLAAPSNVDAYLVNGQIVITWTDVAEDDNLIQGYIVERSTDGNTWTSITSGIVELNRYTDSLIAGLKQVQYRVVAVAENGQRSESSLPVVFDMPSADIASVNLFYVRNVENGLLISLPAVEEKGRNGYAIYRRKAADGNFTKITTLKTGEFDYEDKDVEKNEIYVYTVSVIGENGEEGNQGVSVSCRRR